MRRKKQKFLLFSYSLSTVHQINKLDSAKRRSVGNVIIQKLEKEPSEFVELDEAALLSSFKTCSLYQIFKFLKQ